MSDNDRPGTDIVHIPFHDGELLGALIDGKPYIVLKPAIESMGLDYEGQRQRLARSSWATTCILRVVAADGKNREMVAVDVRTFNMLVVTIEETRVSEHLRPRLIAYQREASDVIEAYFTRGGAINPRATRDQLDTIINTSRLQLETLKAAVGLVHPGWLETKTRHVIARALGEEPELDPATRPLTVGEFMEEKGASAQVIRHLSPTFGRSVAAAYRAAHGGAGPGKADRFIDGALRPVAVYTEADRPLFELVWHEDLYDGCLTG